MKPFIPYEKRNKKAQKEHDKLLRRDWGIISPVTRKSENPKVYNRKKHRLPHDHGDTGAFLLVIN